MELTEAMRTMGTCRYFTDDPVPDEVLRRRSTSARFGPQGGNRQPVRWIVVRDAARKQALADLYLPMWKAYFGGDRRRHGQRRRAAEDRAATPTTSPSTSPRCRRSSWSAPRSTGLHPTDTELGPRSPWSAARRSTRRAELLPGAARPGRRLRGDDAAVPPRAEGPRAAGDPGRRPHRGARRDRLPGEGLPAEADPHRRRGHRVSTRPTAAPLLRRRRRLRSAWLTSPRTAAAAGPGHHRRPAAPARPHPGRTSVAFVSYDADGSPHARPPTASSNARANRDRAAFTCSRGVGRGDRVAVDGAQLRRGRRRLLRRRSRSARRSPAINPLLPGRRGRAPARPRRARGRRRGAGVRRDVGRGDPGRGRATGSSSAPLPGWTRWPRCSPGPPTSPRSTWTRTTSRCSSTRQRHRGRAEGRDDPAPQLPHLHRAGLGLGPADRARRHLAVRDAVPHHRRARVDDHA